MNVNKLIDHTYLKAMGTKKEIEKLCEEARLYNFKSVCVNPTWVKYAHELLEGSEVLVCTVIGFPLGANTPEVKAFETLDAIKNGADEIDMVINVGELIGGNYDYVLEEIKKVRSACEGKTLKVIIETCYLTDELVEKASELTFKAGADFVKTSTGFGTGGALKHHIEIMRRYAQDKGVKASGGVRTYEEVQVMVEAGANRIGTSNGVTIMEKAAPKENY